MRGSPGMQVFGLGGDGRIGSLSQTSLALQRRIGKFGLARFGCRPAWPFVGGGRLTNCRNAVPDAERKTSRAASVSSARLSRSRVAPWVFGGETTEKRQRRWPGLAAWLDGWFAHGSLSDLRWSRSLCISNKFRADPPGSSPCITRSCTIEPLLLDPTPSLLAPCQETPASSLIAHRSPPPWSLFFQLFHFIRTDTPSPHTSLSSSRRPSSPLGIAPSS